MTASTRRVDVLIVGAGAAGLMCAMTAAARGRRTLVVEHTRDIGAKILISGGGRCNFTNLEIAPERFLSENPQFCRSALARYTARDFIALVEKHRIAYYEKTLGQLFCEGAGAAKRIVAMLLAEVHAAGAEVETGVRVDQISTGFTIETDRGSISAESVVLASGGLSIPKLGATDFSHRMAARFGLPIVGVRPGLVPLTFAAEDLQRFSGLAGVSVQGRASAERGPSFNEGCLFTHRGLSGPAVLQASSYWRPGETITLSLTQEANPAQWLKDRKRSRPRAQLASALSELIPARLADAWAPADARTMADWRDRDLDAVAAGLAAWRVAPAGTEGYLKAEVTCGGVSTAALDQKTMMAKSAPGLFVVGEAVDVTGWLGGYNFQWAWSSGWAAGMAA